MSFVTKTVRQRFPKSTFALVIVVILLLVVIVDMMFLNWAIANWAYQFFVIGTINFIMYAPFQFMAGAGVVAAVIGIFMYRRKYGKKEVLMASTPTTPLQNTLTPTSNTMYPSLNPNPEKDLVVEDK